MLITLLSRLVATLQTHDPRDVYGRRNAQMAEAKLVVIEEAETLSLPALKSLITEPQLTIRERGRPRQLPSSHGLLLTTRDVQS